MFCRYKRCRNNNIKTRAKSPKEEVYGYLRLFQAQWCNQIPASVFWSRDIKVRNYAFSFFLSFFKTDKNLTGSRSPVVFLNGFTFALAHYLTFKNLH